MPMSLPPFLCCTVPSPCLPTLSPFSEDGGNSFMPSDHPSHPAVSSNVSLSRTTPFSFLPASSWLSVPFHQLGGRRAVPLVRVGVGSTTPKCVGYEHGGENMSLMWIWERSNGTGPTSLPRTDYRITLTRFPSLNSRNSIPDQVPSQDLPDYVKNFKNVLVTPPAPIPSKEG